VETDGCGRKRERKVAGRNSDLLQPVAESFNRNGIHAGTKRDPLRHCARYARGMLPPIALVTAWRNSGSLSMD